MDASHNKTQSHDVATYRDLARKQVTRRLAALQLPQDGISRLLKGWDAVADRNGIGGHHEASVWLNARLNQRQVLSVKAKQDRAERQSENRLSYAASDAQIRAWARRCACECQNVMARETDLMSAYAFGHNHCLRHGVRPPAQFGKRTLEGLCKRMMDSKWWRKQGRRLVALRVEAAAIKAGSVHSHAQLYASDASVDRQREAQCRNTELLSVMKAVNELGESFSLEELAAKSTSLPGNRRGELMVRLKGVEDVADPASDTGAMISLTCPSRFHARLQVSGKPNYRYDGSTPKEAQAWLQKVWRAVGRELSKRKLRFYGLRVVEPHHDGTPHWHLLVFSGDLQAVIEVIQKAAFKDSGDEKGAEENRLHVAFVDKAKGSATAYLAKYVSKNIDGFGLDKIQTIDENGNPYAVTGAVEAAARRITAWARTWGIRQFQFFGLPSVGIWREARRIGSATQENPILEAARMTADSSDYGAHLQVLGGCQGRKACTVRPWCDETGVCNAYGEVARPRLIGLGRTNQEQRVKTRVHIWQIEFAPKPASDAAAFASRFTLDSCQ